MSDLHEIVFGWYASVFGWGLWAALLLLAGMLVCRWLASRSSDAFADQQDSSWFGRVVSTVFLCICTLCGALKPGGVPMNAPMPRVQVRMIAPSLGISSAEEAAMAEADEGMSLIGNWFRSGGRGRGQVVSFDNGWVFPYGSNHLSSVEIWPTGAVYAGMKDPTPIAAISVPLSPKPQTTRVYCGLTPDGSYRVEWREAYANRDPNQPMDASIDLHRDGTVIITENGVARTIDRELPFAHDGFGQDDDWVRANFTNAAEIISVGYTNWVDAQVGIGLTNGLYKFTVSFKENPPEATEFHIGDYSICVTNAGEYVFLLEKGTGYEFGTWPFDESVDYFIQDDMADGDPMMEPSWGNWESPGEWSVDGGWNWLCYPSRDNSGYCCWMPTLQGSPNVSHLGPKNLPATFTAVLTDYCGSVTPAFHWSASDENIRFGSPNAQTTTVSCASLPSWGSTSLSASTDVGEHTLTSMLHPILGTNETPQVSVTITAPQAVFVNDDGDETGEGRDFEIEGRHHNDDDIVPVVVSFHSDVATNGTLGVMKVIRDGHLWKDAGRTEEVGLSDTIPVSECSDCSKTYYLECEGESYGYQTEAIVVTWQDGNSVLTLGEHRFTAVDCIAEPITSERISFGDGEEHIVNPCCAVIGSNTYMRVHVLPSSLPDDRIVWRVVEGSAIFPGGNTGRDVVIVATGGEDDSLVLEVDVDGIAGRRPRFELLTTTMTEVLLYPYLITGAPGAVLSEQQLQEKLREVNMIYRQVGLHFTSVPIEVVENGEWSEFGLSRRSVGHAIRNYAHKADGVEVYFIDGSAKVIDFSCKPLGQANCEGIVIKCSAPGRVLAHEIGHVCRLADIYIDPNQDEQYGALRQGWMPDDWNNGTGSRFYNPDDRQIDLIPRLLMFGVDKQAESVNYDISLGPVRGLVNDGTSPSGRSFGHAPVGRNIMFTYPPHTE